MRAGPAPSAVFKVETGVKSQGQANAPQNLTPAPLREFPPPSCCPSETSAEHTTCGPPPQSC